MNDLDALKKQVYMLVPNYKNAQGDFAGKIKLLIENITTNENLQLIEILAIVTEIRMCLSANEAPPIKEVLQETNILNFLIQCLAIQTNDVISNCIKLEAAWILINLSVSDDIETIKMLFDQPNEPSLITLIEESFKSGNGELFDELL